MSTRINYRHVLAKIATGPVYARDTSHWLILRNELERIRSHYAEMGLTVVMDEPAGYAYLRQQPDDTDDAWSELRLDPLPAVLRRRMLSYHQTILLVLLRERLLRHDQSPDTDAALYLSEDEIMEMLRPYFPESNNEKKFRDKVQALLTRFDELNLVFPLKDRTDPIYRVEQIIKAKLPAEQIAEILNRLSGKAADTDADDSETNEDLSPHDSSPTNV
ncbi:MAG: DUF4194 domain-containing protein [Puniceicoccales bacterium]|jgi:hypothetical protein|nr:DUF4194 domain-containing protein [Puniceicoccales bacterium]